MKFRNLAVAFLMIFSGQAIFAAELVPIAAWSNKGIQTDGAKVYLSATTTMVAAQINYESAGVLFVAPSSGKVIAKQQQISAAANCGVVQNDLEVQVQLLDLYTNATDDLQKLVESYTKNLSDFDDANKQCLAAKDQNLTDQATACIYSEGLKEIIDESSKQIKISQDSVAALFEKLTKLDERIKKYGKEIGGTLNAVISLYDAEEITKIKNLNPNYDVRFIPVEKVDFQIISGVESAIGYTVSHIGGDLEDLQSHDRLTVDITLSRLGACSESVVVVGRFEYYIRAIPLYQPGEDPATQTSLYKDLASVIMDWHIADELKKLMDTQ